MNQDLTNVLWYKTPAENWHESLPAGNGRLGAMAPGGVNRDTIALNEDSLWGGSPVDKLNPRGLEALPRIRSLIFEGKLAEASKLAREAMVSTPCEPFPYQPLCNLVIQNGRSRPYSSYRRELDLRTAVVKTGFEMGGARYTKEYFVSAPDQVIAVRYTCDRPGAFTLSAGLSRAEHIRYRYPSKNSILLEGFGDEHGIHFAALLNVVPEGGTVSSYSTNVERTIDYPRLSIHSADSVTFYISAATTFRTSNPASEAAAVMERALAKGWDAIRRDHIADYQNLYNRFELELSGTGPGASAAADTAEWLEHIRKGREDPEFYTLYSNYCRYLLISDSRPGSQPGNLQGIWNDMLDPPWQSDYHTNVNFQINYWPVETYNLSECHLPVFDWLERMVPPGEDTARRLYGARGWVFHHCTDIWGMASPVFDILGIWPVGALWCCRDLYEYYLHTRDLGLIRSRGFKLLKGAVEFMLDFLVEAPENTPWAGYLVTNPSHSPENRYYAEDGSAAFFTWAATLDIELLNDMFGICIEFIDAIAGEEPGFEADFKRRLQETLARLPPLRISPTTGGIQEWIDDYREVEPGHRHVSHLYACYPGTQITPEKTPELAEAAAKTIYRRYENGYDSQGWSMGWIANIWARLRNGEELYRSLQDVMKKHILYNLFINAHGNPQVGDMQSSGSAIMEALAQSHDGFIRLLPALPEAWPCGSVRGFKLRGGHELEMKWNDGRLTFARIVSPPGCVDMPVVFNGKETYTITKNGNETLIHRA
ncbi:MAG: glycoside hydrolase family 95 protein [Treponema sp.]|jgi:alpha-L-fucosidase 2|nr:glycoside hydrolase family 95 protein [Treponema sp.]